MKMKFFILVSCFATPLISFSLNAPFLWEDRFDDASFTGKTFSVYASDWNGDSFNSYSILNWFDANGARVEISDGSSLHRQKTINVEKDFWACEHVLWEGDEEYEAYGTDYIYFNIIRSVFYIFRDDMGGYERTLLVWTKNGKRISYVDWEVAEKVTENYGDTLIGDPEPDITHFETFNEDGSWQMKAMISPNDEDDDIWGNFAIRINGIYSVPKDEPETFDDLVKTDYAYRDTMGTATLGTLRSWLLDYLQSQPKYKKNVYDWFRMESPDGTHWRVDFEYGQLIAFAMIENGRTLSLTRDQPKQHVRVYNSTGKELRVKDMSWTGIVTGRFDTMDNDCTSIQVKSKNGYDFYYYISDAYDENENEVEGWSDAGGNLADPVISSGNWFWLKFVTPGTITITPNEPGVK